MNRTFRKNNWESSLYLAFVNKNYVRQRETRTVYFFISFSFNHVGRIGN